MKSRKGTTLWSSVASIAFVLALACPARAQDTCDVVVALADPGPLSVLAYALDYSGAGGSFIGSAFTPTCTKLITGMENTIYDDDVSMLSNFVASQSGVSAPQGLISCIFVPTGGFPCPPSSAFVVTDQAFPPFELIDFEDLFPGLEPPTLTITVTPRVPVCGDGFQEGTEECDDGNVVDGDCCSSACVLAAAGTPCSDGSVCTSAETCDAAGSCNAGAVLTCDDGDPCTSDTCDPTLGCIAPAVPANSFQCTYGDHGSLALRDDANRSSNRSSYRTLPRAPRRSAIRPSTPTTRSASTTRRRTSPHSPLASTSRRVRAGRRSPRRASSTKTSREA